MLRSHARCPRRWPTRLQRRAAARHARRRQTAPPFPTTCVSSSASTSSGECSSLTPASSRAIWPTAQYVIPSPYERHVPRTTRARVPIRETSSATRRDLPTPGSPRMVARRAAPDATTSSNTCSRRSRCSARPVNGVAAGRAIGPKPPTSSRRYAGTGSDFPFAWSGSIASTRTASRTRRKVGSPSSTSPGPAACSSRAATLTGSPVTNVSRLALSPATTSPVLTPIRRAMRVPKRCSRSSFSASRRACISSAARHARRASSSCASGTPKTARTASPTNFSTVPP